MTLTSQALQMRRKRKTKQNLELKSLRILAGYDMRTDFVDAVNQFLEERDINFRVSYSTYGCFESGQSSSIPLKAAYYISQFLNCPIEIFIDKKICL